MVVVGLVIKQSRLRINQFLSSIYSSSLKAAKETLAKNVPSCSAAAAAQWVINSNFGAWLDHFLLYIILDSLSLILLHTAHEGVRGEERTGDRLF